MKEITFKKRFRYYYNVNLCKKWLIKSYVILSVLCLMGINSWSQAITVDGNPGDWEVLEASNPAVYNHIEDPFGNGVIDNQFTEGSKDYNIASQLIWADGQTKAKNDIANAAAYLEGTTLYFAGDKTSNNGDAQIGFWFYLNNTGPRVLQTSPKRSGDFYPEHAIGDLFILIDFTGGGKFGTVSSYVWAGPGNGNYGNNKSLDLAGPGNVAQNNLQEYDVPDGWNFISSMYDENQFFEGSIDLASLEINDACFSRFLVEARSSQELTASLDDFAAGEFNVEPEADVNDITACENDGPFILTAIANGGLGTLEYEWKKLPSDEIIGTSSTLEVTESGQYSVTIIGEGVFGGDCPSQPAIAEVDLIISPDIDDLDDVSICSGTSYNLPTITGTNLTGNEGYFTASGGGGTELNVGDEITTAQTIYIYDVTD
ncbi:MAG: hypothetical protein R3214_14210, partial [Christiangramia sp.]|nr:hypothetical protein [Christiangramia sp.]